MNTETVRVPRYRALRLRSGHSGCRSSPPRLYCARIGLGGARTLMSERRPCPNYHSISRHVHSVRAAFDRPRLVVLLCNQPHAEPCLAFHHACVSIGSLFERNCLDHRANILQNVDSGAFPTLIGQLPRLVLNRSGIPDIRLS